MEFSKRDRQRLFGEVFTPNRIVEKMFSLLDNDAYSPNYKILDSSAGDGAFLKNVLVLKLDKLVKLNTENYIKKSLQSIGSVFGVDLQMTNVILLRKNLKDIWILYFIRKTKKHPDTILLKIIDRILEGTIKQGDSLKYIDENGDDLVMSELTFRNYDFWWNSFYLNPLKPSKPMISKKINLLKILRGENFEI